MLSLISNFFESLDSPEVIPISHVIAKVPSFVQVLSDSLFDLLFFEGGFYRSKPDIIITAFIAIFFSYESSIHALNIFVNSLMNNLQAFPVRRGFFFQ